MFCWLSGDVSRRGRCGADPGIQRQRTGGWTGERVSGGRPVGRSGGRPGAAARRNCAGGSRSGGRRRGRVRERERERDLFLRRDRQEVGWKGKGSLHASAPLWDTRRALDRARVCPGHHHHSIYSHADPLGRVTGHEAVAVTRRDSTTKYAATRNTASP